jgi:hypothetical protein
VVRAFFVKQQEETRAVVKVIGRPLYEKLGFVAEMEKMDPESTSDPMRRRSKVE